VPADRLTQGAFLEQSIWRNTISASVERVTGLFGRLRRPAADTVVADSVRDLSIKIGRESDPVRTLSGGNAQKVVIAKWLATDPKVLILNGPTVGVDIGSKAAILQILRERAACGMAIVLISDDVPELVAVCHRVLVVRRGRLVEEISGDAVQVDTLREGIVA
jgi:simple sugar transport system ATP-binding protein